MNITKDFLQVELKEFEKQHRQAVEVAIATQAAMDVLNAMIARLDLPDEPKQE